MKMNEKKKRMSLEEFKLKSKHITDHLALEALSGGDNPPTCAAYGRDIGDQSGTYTRPTTACGTYRVIK
jgi:hypothetical protein